MNDQHLEQLQSIELTAEELEEIQGGLKASDFLNHFPIGIPWPDLFRNPASQGLNDGLLLPAVQKQVGF